MYLEMVAEEDKKKAEGWKADADGILITIFVRHSLSSGAMRCSHTYLPLAWTGLFSAAVSRNVDLCVNTGHPTEPTGHP